MYIRDRRAGHAKTGYPVCIYSVILAPYFTTRKYNISFFCFFSASLGIQKKSASPLRLADLGGAIRI